MTTLYHILHGNAMAIHAPLVDDESIAHSTDPGNSFSAARVPVNPRDLILKAPGESIEPWPDCEARQKQVRSQPEK